MPNPVAPAGDLFRHVSADKARQYRAIMETFAAAKRQFRLQLRPDEVRLEANWPGPVPVLEEIQLALVQLTAWGNLEAQPDTSRVSSIEDFYRARYLYRLSLGGEAVEAALVTSARTIELQQADVQAVITYKQRLIEYLQRFVSDLVGRSSVIAARIVQLDGCIEPLLAMAAQRERRDAALGGEAQQQAAFARRLASWRERWHGLARWFISEGHIQAQSELLRARARSAIPQLLAAIATLNERRNGRSDCSADFRVLARWFADTPDDDDAHRLWRAAFALHPARHLS